MSLKAKLPLWVFILVASIGIAMIFLLLQYRDSIFDEMKLQSLEDAYWTNKIPQKNELSGWKTYRNEEYGFEFVHPDDMEIIDRDEPSSFLFDFSDFYFRLYLFEKNGKTIDTDFASDLFLFFPSSSYLNAERKLISDNKDKTSVKETLVKCPENGPLKRCSVDEYNPNCPENGFSELCSVIALNSALYGLVYYYFPINDWYTKWIVLFNSEGNRYLLGGSPDENIEYKDIYEFKTKSDQDLKDFNQILSTFKFTGSNLPMGCKNLWWYDNEHSTCQQPKQFCGAYMYHGLQTFETKEECEISKIKP